MRALRLLEWKSEPVLVDVPEPVPGPGQVVIRVGGAGACHSDLHLMHDFDGSQLPWGPPFTLGHENAGWVHQLGEGVTGLQVGQPVAVYGPWGCGACGRCRLGMETYCENPAGAPVPNGGGGLGLDGGMADLLLVPSSRLVVPLPDGLEPVHAAPLTDAGLTPYHAVRRSWAKLPPGSTAVVIGVGGLGHLAIQALKATTAARIVAVDSRQDALDFAADLGADATVLADPHEPGDTPDAVRRATGGHGGHGGLRGGLGGGPGADLVLDLVGSDTTLAIAAAASRTLGDLTLVGIAGGSLPFSFFATAYEVSLQTTYWGSRPELDEVLDLGARGLLRPAVTTVPLEEAPSAYRAMAEGDVHGRFVVVP
ncbi:MAG TPA: NAD(P)-dependent alcohol dehydrogenase [Acidimicrobiales bacterium]|nr:NAD(P)-dependent alcohol dehydrogenase [Acidimicrobiales bacterium]